MTSPDWRNALKNISLIVIALGLVVSAPVFAHGNTRPQHGGVVQLAGETLFELVRSPTGVSIYVVDDEDPLASSTATGKLAVTAGGRTRKVVLEAGPGNRFDAPGLKLAAGTKVAVQVVEKATQARLGTTFVIR